MVTTGNGVEAMTTQKKIEHLRAAMAFLESVEKASVQDDDNDLGMDDLEFLSDVADGVGEMVRELAGRMAP